MNLVFLFISIYLNKTKILKETKDIMHRFIALGFRAVVVCINTKYLDHSFLGRELDHQFISDLPENVDLCGENGEFHTFVYDGPIFKSPVLIEKGDIIFKNYAKDKSHDTNHDFAFGYLDLKHKTL